jgi:hypothetical protein
MRLCSLKFESKFRSVIACDKRKAFAQGSTCDEAIQLSLLPQKLDCFASLAMTLIESRSPDGALAKSGAG